MENLYLTDNPVCDNLLMSSIGANLICLPQKTSLVELPQVKKIIINGPATIVFWKDGSKTIVRKSDEDIYNLRLAFLEAFYDKVTGFTKKQKRNFFTRLFKRIVDNGK